MPRGGARVGAGRPPFEPTKELRSMVAAMAFTGIHADGIAKACRLDRRTLRKHFKEELETETARRVAMVAAALHQNAMQGNVAAQIYIMKTAGGRVAANPHAWKESYVFEGPDGQPANLASPPPLTLIFTDDPNATPDNAPKLINGKGNGAGHGMLPPPLKNGGDAN